MSRIECIKCSDGRAGNCDNCLIYKLSKQLRNTSDKPLTNGDYLRLLSDEELAAVLTDMRRKVADSAFAFFAPFIREDARVSFVSVPMFEMKLQLEWLKSPVCKE